MTCDVTFFAKSLPVAVRVDKTRTLTHTINSEMLELSDWFKANKLSLNVKKSNYVIFKPRQKREEFDKMIRVNLSWCYFG